MKLESKDISLLEGITTPGEPYTLYLLINEGEVVYIGKGMNPTERFSDHRISGKVFGYALLFFGKTKLIHCLETELIQLFDPPENKTVKYNRNPPTCVADAIIRARERARDLGFEPRSSGPVRHCN